MSLEINYSKVQGIVVVEAVGEIHSTNASELGDYLDKRVDEGTYRLVLDIVKVEWLSSAGLRQMVRILKQCKRAGGNLCIVTDKEDKNYGKPMEVLEIAGLTTIFDIFSEQSDAIQNLK
jgi:anti-sigma B factor antagonist